MPRFRRSRRGLVAFSVAMVLVLAVGGGIARAADVSGHVSDPGGGDLGGVTILLTGEATQTAVTDGTGNYLFSGLADGSYFVTPSSTGLKFIPQSYGFDDVEIVGQVNISNLDFTSAVSNTALPGSAVNPLDPMAIPKYVTPLVIPPVMNISGGANTYDIAVRQFDQQILPAGFPPTTVWSYGPTADPLPAVAAPDPASQFNYPAYTLETISDAQVSVRWRNELVEDPIACAVSGYTAQPACNYLPHLLPIDQTLHWANPPATGCRDGSDRTDCHTFNPAPYTGPVPIVTHVHGAHVDPHSDGYPEAWWLPRAADIPGGYSTEGSLFDDAAGQNPGLNLGFADYVYRNDQPATTLWYHDHSLGMTRNNVYAGPAGFWLVRGGANDLTGAELPGPAPVAGQGVVPLNTPADPIRDSIREIPIVIQDRSFHDDGALFYPDSRAHFDGYLGPYTDGPFSGGLAGSSDIAPIWNPEAFFNTMVVNGVTWPRLDVAPALYRLRLLNGCNSRFLNLALFEVDQATGDLANPPVEHPFFQIGAEQGFLPQVIRIETGFATALPGDGSTPAPVPGSDPAQGLLMTLAERADVIVDFRGLIDGTRIRMINTAPDAPFGGFGDPPADPDTTGQVMEFVINSGILDGSPSDPGGTPGDAAEPTLLALPAEAPLPAATVSRDVSLNEEASGQVCVQILPDGTPEAVYVHPTPVDEATLAAICLTTMPPSEPMAPRAAEVGIVDFTNPAAPLGIPLAWTDTSGASTDVPVALQNGGVAMIPVTENPVIVDGVAPVEEWNIYNFTEDAHPIHLHLVRFQVIDRQPIPGIFPEPTPFPQQPWETGYKDTVIAYPEEITTVRAMFDIPGLYVWHCHIVEHEDNEMMRPFVVSTGTAPSAIGVYRNGTWFLDNGDGVWSGCGAFPANDLCAGPFGGSPADKAVAGDWNGDGTEEIGVYRNGTWFLDNGDGVWSGCGAFPANDLCVGPFGGNPTDVPVIGNWDGAGGDEVGVFRVGSGMWFLDNGNGLWDGCGALPAADLCMGPFGANPTDFPIAGDWNGDGTDDVGVYRRSNGMWFLDSGNGVWDNCVTDTCAGPFGANPIDLPAVGDWDGDGADEAGVYRNGTWFLDNGDGFWSGCGAFPANDLCVGPLGGKAGDQPVAGQWQ